MSLTIPKIPKSILKQAEIANRFYRIYSNSYSKGNLVFLQSELFRQQTSYIKMVQRQADDFSKYENLENWSRFINSAISAYKNSAEDDFEIIVEDIPITIVKSKLEEYIEVFKNLKLPISYDLILKLAFSYYIFTLLLLVFSTIPELQKVAEAFATWIFETSGLSFQKYFIKIVSLVDKNNASDLIADSMFDATKLFLFYLFKKGFDNTFKK